MILLIKCCLIFLAICFIFPIIDSLVNISYKDEGKLTLQDELDYEAMIKRMEKNRIKKQFKEKRKLK